MGPTHRPVLVPTMRRSLSPGVPRSGSGPRPAANKRVLFIGDSTTAGVGALGVASSDVGCRPYSVPLKVRDRFLSLGIETLAETVAADNAVGITNAAWNGYRSDVTVTGTLATSSRSPTAGGTLIRGAAGAAFNFTPSVEFDTVEFHYPTAVGFGVLQLLVDGANPTTYNQNAAEGSAVATRTVTKGIHTLTFNISSGTPHGPTLINCYDSTKPSVQIYNAGARNWRAYTNWITATYNLSPLNCMARISPHAVVIDLGINDAVGNVALANYSSAMQSIINAALAAGVPASSIILVVPNPIAGYGTLWSQATMLSLHQSLQAANPGVVLVNAPEVYFTAGLSGATNPADYAALSANGHMADSYHPKAVVYEAEANAVATALQTALGI